MNKNILGLAKEIENKGIELLYKLLIVDKEEVSLTSLCAILSYINNVLDREVIEDA